MSNKQRFTFNCIISSSSNYIVVFICLFSLTSRHTRVTSTFFWVLTLICRVLFSFSFTVIVNIGTRIGFGTARFGSNIFRCCTDTSSSTFWGYWCFLRLTTRSYYRPFRSRLWHLFKLGQIEFVHNRLRTGNVPVECQHNPERFIQVCFSHYSVIKTQPNLINSFVTYVMVCSITPFARYQLYETIKEVLHLKWAMQTEFLKYRH